MNNNLILTRMKSIRQTVQVTNAQKLVASSHIGKARRMLRESEPYHDRIRQSIASVLAVNPEVSSGFLDTGVLNGSLKRGVLVISSDRGLAGGYNSNLMKMTIQSLKEVKPELLVVLGRLGQRYLRKEGYKIDNTFESFIDPPTFLFSGDIAQALITMYEERRVNCVDVIYTHYVNSVRLVPTVVRLFPLEPSVFGTPERLRGDVSFEPSADEVMSMLMPKYLRGYIYGCLVHAWTSELASRISAMDNAMRNGNEMLDALSLAYNRARQGKITQEITEIVAGAASMAEEE